MPSPTKIDAAEGVFERFMDVVKIKGISQFIDEFESRMPPSELADAMVNIIRDEGSSNREKLFCINFFLSAKKFQEKNKPEVTDADLDLMTENQIKAMLKTNFDINERTRGKKRAKEEAQA